MKIVPPQFLQSTLLREFRYPEPPSYRALLSAIKHGVLLHDQFAVYAEQEGLGRALTDKNGRTFLLPDGSLANQWCKARRKLQKQ